eukprot:10164_1
MAIGGGIEPRDGIKPRDDTIFGCGVNQFDLTLIRCAWCRSLMEHAREGKANMVITGIVTSSESQAAIQEIYENYDVNELDGNHVVNGMDNFDCDGWFIAMRCMDHIILFVFVF